MGCEGCNNCNSNCSEESQICYDPLMVFLYLIMRDIVPVGNVDRIVKDTMSSVEKGFVPDNVWLAKYANKISDQIYHAKEIELKKALEEAFKLEEYKRKTKSERPSISCGTNVKQESEEETPTFYIHSAEELEEEPIEEINDISVSSKYIEDIKSAINKLKEENFISEDFAKTLQDEASSISEKKSSSEQQNEFSRSNVKTNSLHDMENKVHKILTRTKILK